MSASEADLARVDDELHARLKERAAAEGRSMNDVVTDALEWSRGPKG